MKPVLIGVCFFALIGGAWPWVFWSSSARPQWSNKDEHGHDRLWNGCHGVKQTGYYAGKMYYSESDGTWNTLLGAHWVDEYGHWIGAHSMHQIERCFETRKEAKSFSASILSQINR